MYVIAGASGNTGKPLALSLLNAGKKVRVISRTEEKAKELVDKGAELFLGDSAKGEDLKKAFEGATAVYVLIPNNIQADDYYSYQQQVSHAIASAIKSNNIKYAVTLSSVGAQLEEDSGVIYGLRYLEQTLNKIDGLNVLHLRPTYFMENTFSQLSIIKEMGAMGSPVTADIPLSMIATKDIGEYAAKRLIALDFEGKSHQYLLGERNLTYNEVASVYGKVLNKPDLKYTQFSIEDFRNGLRGIGASESLISRMEIFVKAGNDNKLFKGVERTEESTTPTTIEEFAKTFAHVYNNS